MSAKAAFSAFLADQAISIYVPADRSVMYSSETSQPTQVDGAGVGMLRQCSCLGLRAARQTGLVISAAHRRADNF